MPEEHERSVRFRQAPPIMKYVIRAISLICQVAVLAFLLFLLSIFLMIPYTGAGLSLVIGSTVVAVIIVAVEAFLVTKFDIW